MSCSDPAATIARLALYGAIFTLIGDFIALLIAYQTYCEELKERNKNQLGNNQNGSNKEQVNQDETLLLPRERPLTERFFSRYTL